MYELIDDQAHLEPWINSLLLVTSHSRISTIDDTTGHKAALCSPNITIILVIFVVPESESIVGVHTFFDPANADSRGC